MKKAVCGRWKWEQATSSTVTAYCLGMQDGIRKAKLSWRGYLQEIYNNMKSLCCYICSERIKNENVGLLLSVVSGLATAGDDKAEVVNDFFASACTYKVSQSLCTYRQGSSKSIIGSGREVIQGAFEKYWSAHMRPDERNHKVLKELYFSFFWFFRLLNSGSFLFHNEIWGKLRLQQYRKRRSWVQYFINLTGHFPV